MGAWSHEAFGNDDALDFLDELDGARSWALVQTRLAETMQYPEYLEAPDASQAVAAAALVAMSSGFVADLPESYTHLIGILGRAPANLNASAAQVVARVIGANSELADLWAEAEDPSWINYMDDLQKALMGPSGA